MPERRIKQRSNSPLLIEPSIPYVTLSVLRFFSSGDGHIAEQLLVEIDRLVGARWNANSIQIADRMINDGDSINNLDCINGTGNNTVSASMTLIFVYNDFHRNSFHVVNTVIVDEIPARVKNSHGFDVLGG